MSLSYSHLNPSNLNRPALKDKVLYNETDSIFKLASRLYQHLYLVPSTKDLVVMCIGTDRSTGDALGPIIGTKLSEANLNQIHVYGTLNEPVHAVNLQDNLTSIQTTHHDPFIIAIDACLGQLNSIGHVQIGTGPLKPGAGVKKNLPSVGDLHITGIVNVGGFMEYFVLQNTRLNLVMNMAEVISSSIQHSVLNLTRKAVSDPF